MHCREPEEEAGNNGCICAIGHTEKCPISDSHCIETGHSPAYSFALVINRWLNRGHYQNGIIIELLVTDMYRRKIFI